MPYTTILSAADLAAHRRPDWVILDCRFNLSDPDAGQAAFHESHIDGAHYVHLDNDLSGTVFPGVSGRHPLPDPGGFRRLMGGWGLAPERQVVAYDQGPGAFAARLWWLLRYHGHSAVAVLDGGFSAWTASGLPVSDRKPEQAAVGTSPAGSAAYPVLPPVSSAVSMQEVISGTYHLVDARAGERFRGEIEPLDPVAGHIPGAVSRPFMDNLTASGLFRPAHELRSRFAGIGSPERQVHYCGSGVTAAHNVLAMAVAGLPDARLYPGSWSEWVTLPENPVEVGAG